MPSSIPHLYLFSGRLIFTLFDQSSFFQASLCCDETFGSFTIFSFPFVLLVSIFDFDVGPYHLA